MTDLHSVISVDDDGDDIVAVELTQESDKTEAKDRTPVVRDEEPFVSSSHPIKMEPDTSSPLLEGTKRHPETGLFTDGSYAAANVKLHYNPHSIAILDTPVDGTLHVISGWTPPEVLSDLCYSFEPWGSWGAKKCGFLGMSQVRMKKGYKCNGVKACPVLLRSMGNYEHSTAQEWKGLQALTKDTNRETELLEMKKARNLYVALTNPDANFCTAVLCEEADILAAGGTKCDGTPTVRTVHATKECFVGCSHYYKYKNVSKRHFFLSLRNYTATARRYLLEMIRKGEPIVIPGDACEFVAVKKGRASKRCATHGAELVGAGTITSETGRCPARMLLIQGIPGTEGNGEGPSSTPITYAICMNPHNHPPPPQPSSTERKKEVFRSFAERTPNASASVIQLQAQRALSTGTSVTMGNLKLSKNNVYNVLATIRKNNEREQFDSMFEMMESGNDGYVRDIQLVKDGMVFLLATEEMLLRASERFVFAGDATFKTVMETNPHCVTPTWYLYNIVAPFDATTPKHTGIVVCRALMTSLTTEAYAAVWVMFLKAMKRVKAKRFGLQEGEVSLDVPYLPVEPDRKRNAITVRAITTDFEVAEVEGIANAFAEHRGGNANTHRSHLLVGCRVHFERAMLRRAASMADPEKAKFKDACRKLRCTTCTKEGDEYYAIIHGIDNAWGAWLSRSHVRPLVSPAFSNMTDVDRMMALDNTNIVESQNRRGNLICGTRMNPVLCTQRLRELDTITTTILSTTVPTTGQAIPKPRSRNSHTLAPSTGPEQNGGGGRQSRGKKRKTSEAATKLNKRKKVLDVDAMTTELNDSLDSGDALVIPSNCSQSLKWLHDELGSRCQKAGGQHNEKLLVALSELYSSVLKCNDLNKIKYNILRTMRKESADKAIVQEFSELLVMTSKREGDDSGKRDAPHTPVKDEDSIVNVDDHSNDTSCQNAEPIDVVQID